MERINYVGVEGVGQYRRGNEKIPADPQLVGRYGMITLVPAMLLKDDNTMHGHRKHKLTNAHATTRGIV